jgi:cleavage and polyadenylation specificity factor subunit 3
LAAFLENELEVCDAANRYLQGLVFVEVGGQHVVYNPKSGKVQCADDALRGRVEKALRRMQLALQPCDVSNLS